ncbi:hypothetical protein [Subtercola boreus]|nr:hypothetical protein [Subtercola boreus]
MPDDTGRSLARILRANLFTLFNGIVGASFLLLVDDLLVLCPGGQIVADAELVDGSDIEVDESLLTGEANPVSAKVGRTLLSGSTVVAGGGLARVIRVGTDSYSAQITLEARKFTLVRSKLRESSARNPAGYPSG